MSVLNISYAELIINTILYAHSMDIDEYKIGTFISDISDNITNQILRYT